MGKNEYSRSLTTGTIAHVEGESLVIVGPAHMDGSTLVIDAVNFLPQEVDYTDNDSVKILATSAVHTADGFYDLVKRNCNTSRTGTHIHHFGARMEEIRHIHKLCNGKGMQHVVQHKFVYILTAHHINLAVPIFVQRLQHLKLLLLPWGKPLEILIYNHSSSSRTLLIE